MEPILACTTVHDAVAEPFVACATLSDAITGPVVAFVTLPDAISDLKRGVQHHPMPFQSLR